MLGMAQEQAAIVSIPSVHWRDKHRLRARVEIENLTGHYLPSGVGFRRIFIEFVVKDGDGGVLWASGRTNKLGAIVDGTTDNVLPSEEPLAYPKTPFQPHYQFITRQDQVQIYQELVRDSEGRLTTSFLGRAERAKDNRIRPRGYDPKRFFYSQSRYIRELAKTPGRARFDADYQNPDRTGADRIDYLISLAPDMADRATQVEVILYNQSIPPFYLQERFRDAGLGPTRAEEIQRLYYMTSHLNVNNADEAGQARELAGWKLKIAACGKAIPDRMSHHKPKYNERDGNHRAKDHFFYEKHP